MIDHALQTHPILFLLWAIFIGLWAGMTIGLILHKLICPLYLAKIARKNMAVSEQITRVNDENGEK